VHRNFWGRGLIDFRCLDAGSVSVEFEIWVEALMTAVYGMATHRNFLGKDICIVTFGGKVGLISGHPDDCFISEQSEIWTRAWVAAAHGPAAHRNFSGKGNAS
jgi:hypothetical protein